MGLGKDAAQFILRLYDPNTVNLISLRKDGIWWIDFGAKQEERTSDRTDEEDSSLLNFC